MAESRRNLLWWLFGGVAVLKGGSEFFSSQENNNGGTSDNHEADSDLSNLEGNVSDLSSEDLEESGSQESLYHERQNVYLQPGQVFAETFKSEGKNTLRIEISDFPTSDSYLGLYKYDEWLKLKRGMEKNGNYKGGQPITSFPESPKSTYEFTLTSDGDYAIVLILYDNIKTESQNVNFQYWILD